MSEPLFDKIALIGIGLIGGSIALGFLLGLLPALLSILGQADALLIRPIDAPACHAGDTVAYLPL